MLFYDLDLHCLRMQAFRICLVDKIKDGAPIHRYLLPIIFLLHDFYFSDLYAQMKLKFEICDDDLDILEEIIPLQQPYKAGKPWKFAGAFYYATTVLTTIGMLPQYSQQ